ncbi:MAG: serine hydrolase domain-containing protein [Desertimonas sp.]
MLEGSVDPAFGAVGDAFRANFGRGEVGAACCVVVDGRVVVDAWGGYADAAQTRPWRADTLVNTYSVGKPMIALRALQLVAAGAVDLDGRADRWWPELRAGQMGATVRDLLCHRAGLPAIRQPLTNDDLWRWDRMCAAIAATDPWWRPGTRHAYHTNTYGYLLGELARRVDGRRPGRWWRDEIAGPLDADLAWGLGPTDRRRCADVVWQLAPPPNEPAEEPATAVEDPPTGGDLVASIDDVPPLDDVEEMIRLGYANPPGFSGIGVMNTDEWRGAEVPSTNLHATARGVARVYTALAAGGRLGGVTVADHAVLAEATRTQSEGWCPVLGRDASFGLGFQPTRPDRPFGPNPGSFGHFGTGGSLGFADPVSGVAFGYVMNAVVPRWQNPRNRALVDAVYACL